MKNIILGLIISFGVVGTGSSVCSMETAPDGMKSETQTKKLIVNIVEQRDVKVLSGTSMSNFIVPGGTGFCKVFLPKHVKTTEQCLEYAHSCSIRNPMTMREYVHGQTGPKTIIVGSGLFQTMLQPIAMTEFKNSFFVDTDKELYPDMRSEFNFNFVYDESVINFQDTFDAIYFDDFSDLYNDETLQAAALMLKPGGKLVMTYRDNGNGIDLSQDNREIFLALNHEYIESIEQKKMTISSQQQHYDLLLDFWRAQISQTLIKCGFCEPVFSEKRTPLRLNGVNHRHIHAWKK